MQLSTFVTYVRNNVNKTNLRFNNLRCNNLRNAIVVRRFIGINGRRHRRKSFLQQTAFIIKKTDKQNTDIENIFIVFWKVSVLISPNYISNITMYNKRYIAAICLDLRYSLLVCNTTIRNTTFTTLKAEYSQNYPDFLEPIKVTEVMQMK